MPPTIDRQGKVFDLLESVGGEVAVNADTPANTPVVHFPRECTFAWLVEFESSGVIDVAVTLQERFRTTDDFVVPDNKVANPMFEQIQDANQHQTAYAPNAAFQGRLLLTGSTLNDASTKIVKALMYAVKT